MTPESILSEPARPRLPYLDGWRGLSILAVLMGHFLPVPGINLGRLGVELFFVLSGRLMAEILFVDRMALPHFFRRRIARIVPGLAAFVLAMVAAHFLVTALAGRAGPFRLAGQDVAAVATLTANYVFAFNHTESVLAHIWSVCIEEHAYILLAGIALLTARQARTAMAILLLVCVLGATLGIAGTLEGGGYREIYWRTDVRLVSIFLSSSLFLFFWFNPGVAQRLGGWWPLLLAGAGVALFMDGIPHYLSHTLGTCCLALALNLLTNADLRIRRLLEARILVTFGLWSFSIYLWQQPFSYMVDYHAIAPLPLLLAAMAAGVASFRLIEQPARRWLNRNWRGSDASVAGAKHILKQTAG